MRAGSRIVSARQAYIGSRFLNRGLSARQGLCRPAGPIDTIVRWVGGAFRLFCTFRLFLAGSTATLAKKPEAGAKAVKEEDCFQSQTAICTHFADVGEAERLASDGT